MRTSVSVRNACCNIVVVGAVRLRTNRILLAMISRGRDARSGHALPARTVLVRTNGITTEYLIPFSLPLHPSRPVIILAEDV